MTHDGHARAEHRHRDELPASLNRTAFAATWHCLTGCAIGEILGFVIATALDWGDVASIALAVALAFLFGYSLTLRPLVRGGVSLRNAARLALAADTVSIAITTERSISDRGEDLGAIWCGVAGSGAGSPGVTSPFPQVPSTGPRLRRPRGGRAPGRPG